MDRYSVDNKAIYDHNEQLQQIIHQQIIPQCTTLQQYDVAVRKFTLVLLTNCELFCILVIWSYLSGPDVAAFITFILGFIASIFAIHTKKNITQTWPYTMLLLSVTLLGVIIYLVTGHIPFIPPYVVPIRCSWFLALLIFFAIFGFLWLLVIDIQEIFQLIQNGVFNNIESDLDTITTSDSTAAAGAASSSNTATTASTTTDAVVSVSVVEINHRNNSSRVEDIDILGCCALMIEFLLGPVIDIILVYYLVRLQHMISMQCLNKYWRVGL